MSELVPFDELDFAATVTSGQVFRFTCADDIWRGPDGDDVIHAERGTKGWHVQSAPDETAYQRFLQLDKSWKDIADEVCRIEPRIAPIVNRHPGLRLLRCGNPTETLFSFLCTPNNHLARIVKMVGYLGEKGSGGKFPSLEILLQVQERDLTAAGFGYRSRAIVGAARLLDELGGSTWLESLKAMDYGDAVCKLLQIPGVGPKVADCVALFGLHFDIAVPLDVHLWRTACELFRPELREATPTLGRYRAVQGKFVEAFGELSGWAQQFLFYDRLTRSRRTI